ncbi:MAG: hypothetical protein WD509_00430 [Candidatus Paceibacterota bacterium]
MDKKEKTEFLNFKHARLSEQRAQMEQIQKDGVCPFCIEYFTKYHTAEIEREGKWWLVSKNDFPYEGTSIHYILVYKKHIVQPSEIDPEAWEEFGEHINYLNTTHTPKGGSFFMRFGDTDYTGGSIDHLHAQFLVGSAYSEDAEKIKVKLGYKK